MKTPDVTPAQILSGIATVLGFLVSRTMITNNQAQLISEIASIVVPVAVTFADAHIRVGRAKVAAAGVAGVQKQS